jgi:hypothetical protein
MFVRSIFAPSTFIPVEFTTEPQREPPSTCAPSCMRTCNGQRASVLPPRLLGVGVAVGAHRRRPCVVIPHLSLSKGIAPPRPYVQPCRVQRSTLAGVTPPASCPSPLASHLLPLAPCPSPLAPRPSPLASRLPPLAPRPSPLASSRLPPLASHLLPLAPRLLPLAPRLPPERTLQCNRSAVFRLRLQSARRAGSGSRRQPAPQRTLPATPTR